MKKHNPEDLREALRSSGAYSDLTDGQARDTLLLLGLDVLPEKPEPRTWHFTDNFTPGRKFAAFVDAAGGLLVCDPSVPVVRWDRDEEWPALTPARVVFEAEWEHAISLREHRDALRTELGVTVEERNKWRDRAGMLEARVTELTPTAPVQLTEGDLEAAYPHDEPNAYGMLTLDAFGPADRRALVRMCQNLLAKHGHGRVEVSRELPSRARVEHALIDGLKGTGEDLSYKARQRATEAVMALLGGGDRG